MNQEQWAIFNSKPIGRMRWFASHLNWRALQLERIIFSQDEIEKWNVPDSGIITYYMTPDLKFNLQINETPNGQSCTHQATIKADRYGIGNIGWHPFTLHEDDASLLGEVERLRPWLERNQYKNRKWLRQFKSEHPELLFPTRKKRRGRPT